MRTKHLIRAVPIAFVGGVLCALACGSLLAADAKSTISADDAIQLLTDGNKRFASGKAERPNTDLNRVEATAKHGQAPFAAVLSCADSRVPVETVFDRGVGDLFVVRVAGNVADPGTLGSIEYAAEHLHTPLVVVMGHTQCGAVKAALDGAELHGNLPSLIDRIRPAVQTVRRQNHDATPEQLFKAAIAQNVRQQIDDAEVKSSLLRQMVLNGKLKIVGALYHIENGQVDWFNEVGEPVKK